MKSIKFLFSLVALVFVSQLGMAQHLNTPAVDKTEKAQKKKEDKVTRKTGKPFLKNKQEKKTAKAAVKGERKAAKSGKKSNLEIEKEARKKAKNKSSATSKGTSKKGKVSKLKQNTKLRREIEAKE